LIFNCPSGIDVWFPCPPANPGTSSPPTFLSFPPPVFPCGPRDTDLATLTTCDIRSPLTHDLASGVFLFPFSLLTPKKKQLTDHSPKLSPVFPCLLCPPPSPFHSHLLSQWMIVVVSLWKRTSFFPWSAPSPTLPFFSFPRPAK